ncbi:hypothetical protein KCU92_g42, partial [Aureobasidium melanogenum]
LDIVNATTIVYTISGTWALHSRFRDQQWKELLRRSDRQHRVWLGQTIRAWFRQSWTRHGWVAWELQKHLAGHSGP